MKLSQLFGLSARPTSFAGSDEGPAIDTAVTVIPLRAPERDQGYEIVAAIARARLLHPISYPATLPRDRP